MLQRKKNCGKDQRQGWENAVWSVAIDLLEVWNCKGATKKKEFWRKAIRESMVQKWTRVSQQKKEEEEMVTTQYFSLDFPLQFPPHLPTTFRNNPFKGPFCCCSPLLSPHVPQALALFLYPHCHFCIWLICPPSRRRQEVFETSLHFYLSAWHRP